MKLLVTLIVVVLLRGPIGPYTIQKHYVQKGDTCAEIAAVYNIHVSQIKKPLCLLRVGETLVLHVR